MADSLDSMTLMAVHAHPDDEVIGTGGTLSRYAAAGARVILVCATRGEVGEIVDPTIDESEARPRLAEIREGELQCACGVLGVRDLIFLDYRDSGMMGTADNDNPESFWQASTDEAVGRLVRAIRSARPQVLVTYDEKGGYGHPDHMKTHQVTVAAFDAAGDPARYLESGLPPWQPSKLYFTALPLSQLRQMEEYFRSVGITSPFEREDLTPERMGTPDEQITTKVDVRQYLDKKLEALRCHRTQIAADSFFFKLPEIFNGEAMAYESFVRARSLVDAPIPESDLFAGVTENG